MGRQERKRPIESKRATHATPFAVAVVGAAANVAGVFPELVVGRVVPARALCQRRLDLDRGKALDDLADARRILADVTHPVARNCRCRRVRVGVIVRRVQVRQDVRPPTARLGGKLANCSQALHRRCSQC